MRRSWRYYVGQIAPSSVNLDDKTGRASRSCFVILMDPKLPKIRIRTRKAREYLGQRIVVVWLILGQLIQDILMDILLEL